VVLHLYDGDGDGDMCLSVCLCVQLYLQRMEEENQRRREAEEMILLLENEEKDLILRLKRSQDLQQQVLQLSCGNSLMDLIRLFLRRIRFCSGLWNLRAPLTAWPDDLVWDYSTVHRGCRSCVYL